MTRIKSILLIVIVIILFSFSGLSQLEYGIKISPGFSKISTIEAHYDNWEQEDVFTPSVNGGVFLEYHLESPLYFEWHLGLNQINGHENVVFYHTGDDGLLNGYKSNITIKRRITYLSYPFSMGVQVKNFDFKLGVMMGLALKSSSKEEGYIENFDIQYESESNDLAIHNLDYGPQASIQYNVTPGFALDVNYYFGVRNIQANNQISTKWKNQQFGIGLKLFLFQVEVL